MVVAFIGCAPQSSVEDAADYVFVNGKIYTVNEQQPRAEAVAVRGNEIVYVGDNAGSQTFAGEGTEKIDLEGRSFPRGP